jgi:hypothetical protein
MPRVHKCRANKDYPQHGIKRGDTYYHWAFFRGRKQMSKTPPRRSQITASENLSSAYAAQETLEDALADAVTVEDVKTALEEAVSALEEVIGDYDESISNLEQAFTGGCPALEEKQAQRDAVEAYKDELEQAASDVDNVDLTEHLDEEVRRAAWVTQQESEHEEEEDFEVDEDAFELPESIEWDDLSEEEKSDARDAALEIANGPEFSI